jgi:ketosteroid isomerase-like protein
MAATRCGCKSRSHRVEYCFHFIENVQAGGAVMVENDQYAILAAKTEYREAYNNADVDRLLRVFASEFTDCSDGEPSFYGEESVRALRLRTIELFRRFHVEIVVIIIGVEIKGDFAYDWGWHKVRLTDKETRTVTDTKYRYLEIWKKENGAWKIDYIITNKELPPRMLPDENADSTSAITTGSQTNP